MAVAAGKNPNFDRISLRNGSAVITGGVAYTREAIVADVGTLVGGSIYISSGTLGAIWVMQTVTWTHLSIS